ncbi:hypothetical protein [Celeribacter sp.]|uniref:hypothetical protein n=1 Tax=Celeribacter sp. TaxID=1890673 RepID=UPI003A94D6E8
MSRFIFAHAGRTGSLAWLRYKAKESWYLARALCLIGQADAPVVVLHNSVTSNLRISREFLSLRAEGLGLHGAQLLVVPGTFRRSDIRTVLTALLLLVLPLSAMQRLTRKRLAAWATGIETLVIFFDGHLSGYVLARASKDLGLETATLQHGLYRHDDVGSRMALANFSSDTVYLWETITRDEFIRFGVAPGRLHVCGQYGFSHLTARQNDPQSTDMVALCPPYDRDRVGDFADFATKLVPGREIQFSLHPILTKAFPDLRSERLAAMSPRPDVSICGDSAVILDSLSCGIPVISVGPRALARTHIFFTDPKPTESEWEDIMLKAKAAYNDDLQTFGFKLD